MQSSQLSDIVKVSLHPGCRIVSTLDPSTITHFTYLFKRELCMLLA